MKTRGSCMALYARSTLPPVLAILAVTALTEWLFFIRALGDEWEVRFSAVLEKGYTGRIAAVALVLVCLVLCWGGGSRGSRTIYTMRRLPIREEEAVMWQGLYGACCFLMLWAVQGGLLLAMARTYLAAQTGWNATGAALLALSYEETLFHALVPLEQWIGWVRNLLLLLALGLNCACAGYKRRRGKPPVSSVVLVLGTLATFLFDMGSVDGPIFGGAVAAGVLAVDFCILWFPVEERDQAPAVQGKEGP